MRQNNTIKRVNGFADAFYCLPANMLTKVQNEICNEMGWAYSTFNSKRNGVRKLTNPEKILIKKVFKKYNIEYATEEN